MAISTKSSTLNHALQRASELIYKPFLYQLATTCTPPSSPTPPPSTHGLYCICPTTAIDLPLLFSKDLIGHLFYYSHFTLSIYIHYTPHEWVYCFYTEASAPSSLLLHLLDCLLSQFPQLHYYFAPPPLWEDTVFTEITLLSCMTPLHATPSPSSFHSPYDLLILLEPLGYPTLLEKINQLQNLHQSLFPFIEHTFTETSTETSTASNAANHAHTKNETQSESKTCGTTATDYGYTTQGQTPSVNYKYSNTLTTTYSDTVTKHHADTQSNNHTVSNSTSNFESCNHGQNCSEGKTYTENSKQQIHFLNKQAEQTLADTETLLNYYKTLQSSTTYSVALYFMSSSPLDSLCMATQYASLVNPNPTLVNPQFINVFSAPSPLFEYVCHSLNACHPIQPYYPPLGHTIQPTQIGSNEQLHTLLYPLT